MTTEAARKTWPETSGECLIPPSAPLARGGVGRVCRWGSRGLGPHARMPPMTAMQDGPVGAAPEAPGAAHAAALLRHAQNVADELVAHAQEEAREAEERARTLRIEAEDIHAEALRAREQAR